MNQNISYCAIHDSKDLTLRMLELVQAILKLKELLGVNGEYSICREDGKNLQLHEIMLIGSVLERISNAIEAIELKYLSYEKNFERINEKESFSHLQ